MRRVAAVCLLLLLYGCTAGQTEGGEAAASANISAEGENMKKIVMIIAPEMFRDEELLIPKQHFEGKGLKVTVASTKKGACKGSRGGVVNSELTLDEVNVSNFDAVLYVGGGGTPVIRKEARALEIAQEAVGQRKVLGAICWATTTLAKAGVLEGKNATVWVGEDSEFGMDTNAYIESMGAAYVAKGVVVDGKIATADGPAHAQEWAIEVEKLLGK
jgi:protease I